MEMIKGEPVSTGIARGRAYVLPPAGHELVPRRVIEAFEVESEADRFERAIGEARVELLSLRDAVAEQIGPHEAEILAAQAGVLVDPEFIGQVVTLIRERRMNAEAALSEVIEGATVAFERISDAYLRERAADFRDVGRRIMGALLQHDLDGARIPHGAVVVSEELLPSTTARLELGHVHAFVTERGGPFSHSSILARSLGTPALVGIADAVRRIKTGDHLIVDGALGAVFIEPDESVEVEYAAIEAGIRAHRELLKDSVGLPSITRDGAAISVLANVNKYADTELAYLYNVDGIGLYRTEFGFSVRSSFPTEDEQYDVLRRVAARMHPRPVVFRLLDMGGDKTLPYWRLPRARVHALGERGVRLLLRHPTLLRTQLRAFLRVSADFAASILVPVVTGVEDVRAVRSIVEQTKTELSVQGLGFDPRVPLGAMIEVPSAAIVADKLARYVDFFSLGTNDLVQYLVAADREGSASHYAPLHPAVLRLIGELAKTAAATGRELTICGEMGGNPRYVGLLVGLGLRRFSVSLGQLLEVREAIRAVDVSEAEAFAARVLTLDSADEVEALLAREPPPMGTRTAFARPST